MAFSTENVGDELLDSINRPFYNLPELLDALMRALAERVSFTKGVLRVDGRGTLLVGRADGEIATDWIGEDSAPGAAPVRLSLPSGRGLVALSIDYAGTVIGELRLDLDAASAGGDRPPAPLRHFARHCGLLVKRYDVRRWSEQRLGRPLLLVGMSRPLLEIDSFIEISAQDRLPLPVLLRGEFGTEKAQLAAAIHCCSASAAGPFVQIDCAEPGEPPAAWAARAEGGTLYLGDIDELEPRLQKQLPQHLPSRLDQWLAGPGAPPVRIVASTTADLHQRAREGSFSRALLAELDFLPLTVPPLRERESDIEALIWHALERNGYQAAEKCTDALIALCRAYDWPENLFELERVIARLAVMTEGRPIEAEDIARHAPHILPSGAAASPGRPAHRMRVDPAALKADYWVRCAVEGEAQAMNGLHHALRKALTNLGSCYAEPISLPELARHAGVSPSHLGFLFRSAVGMPFKTLLGHIRIRKAREMLAAGDGGNITQVAMSVGYSDLSHFERSFRRIVGQCPREYRRSAGMH